MTTLQLPLRVDTQHDRRQVVLGCDACAVRSVVTTRDAVPAFTARVAGFFEEHAGCLVR